MLGKINIVEKYGTKILELIKILKKQCQNSMEAVGMKYVFSTVHKFKGLEMNHVRLLDDFNFAGVPYSKHDPNTFKGKEKDEMNLLYVALTRAKKSLTMNSALFFLFTSKHTGENLQRLSYCQSLEIFPNMFACIQVGQKIYCRFSLLYCREQTMKKLLLHLNQSRIVLL